ncbi:MAG: hypothetical protein K2J85_06595, partial [Anaeroplasmataceae bacterium]|nr:hypothetical protein [Anaeroplasmataceae bacterium]
MRKRKILAFWDVLILSIISAVLFSELVYIIIVIKGDIPWYSVPWYYTLIAAFCFAIPIGLIMFIQRVTIDFNCDNVNFFYLVNFAKNDRDLNTNWIISPSQIDKITI